MNTLAMNLFIVDNSKENVSSLKQHLNQRFGMNINISEFYTGESCLEKIDKHTDFVILAYYLNGKNGNEILERIRKINPNTTVVMLTSNEDVAAIIESFQKGATDYIIKDIYAWKKLVPHIYRKITEPIRRLGNEYGFPKFLTIFFGSFILMGIVVYFVLKLSPL